MKTLFLKTSAFIIIADIFLIGCFSFAQNFDYFSINFDALLPMQNDARENIDKEQEKIGLPLRLKIPIIGIDSPIEALGLTPDGAMAVSEEPMNASWFDAGTIPGEEGSAVIGGHHGLKNKVGVFYDLSKLRKGDMIYVENKQGKSVSFVVRESHIYDFEADTKNIFTSTSGKHLNLITCVGNRDSIRKAYIYRRIIFADIVE